MDRAAFLPRYLARMDRPWLLAGLCAGTLLAPLHPVLMGIFAAALLALCLLCAVPEIAAAYVFLFLFDNVLAFAPLGGSLVRVMQLGMVLRMGWMLCKGALRIDRTSVMVAAVVLASCALSYMLKGLTSDIVSFATNMAVLVLLRLALRGQAENTQADTARDLLMTYVCASVCAVIFGMVYHRFVWNGDTFLSTRFMGSHESNFTAMFMDVALLIWLVLSPAAALAPKAWRGSMRVRLIDAAVVGILLAGMLMTGSVTGLAIAGLMLLGFLIQHRQRFGALMVRGCAALTVVALVVGISALTVRRKSFSDMVGGIVSTGVVSADTPNFIDQAQYRALHQAGQPLDGHLLTMREWEIQRTAQGLPYTWEQKPGDLDPNSPLTKIPGIGLRIQKVVTNLQTYGLDVATSGRFGLAREKIQDYRDFPLWQQLIGRGPDLEKTYFPMFYCLGFSHNSYLDMLTGFGALGLLALLVWFGSRLMGGQCLGMPVAGDTREALTYARAAILLHAAVLSMHLNRMLLFFFL